MSSVAILVTQGFEDSELRVPVERLGYAGHDVTIVGLRTGQVIEGKQNAYRATVSREAGTVSASEFDALVIPGGYSPDVLRIDEGAVRMVRAFITAGKPVAAVCHGPQLLIEADAVRGRRMTSWPSIRTDLINAGALWVDEPVVVDGALITARKPADLGDFCDALIEQLG